MIPGMPHGGRSGRVAAGQSGAWLLPCLLSVLALWVVGVFVGIPRVQGDGRQYYAMTLSLAKDGDFNLANQRDAASVLRLRNGRWVCPYAPGFALFYYPFLKAALGLERCGQPLFELSLATDVAGHTRLNRSLAVLLGSIVWGSVALWVSCRAASFLVPGWRAGVASWACFVGGHLVAYCLFLPSYSHALDAAVVGVGLWLLLRAAMATGGSRPWLFAGFVLGAAMVVRLVNASILAGAVLVALMAGGSARERLRNAGAVIAGSLPCAVLILAYQTRTYGALVSTVYGQQTGTLPVHVLEPLLSSPHGLLRWSPFLVFSFVGWFLLPRRLALACGVPFAVNLLALGFYGRHEAGVYYGGRYLVQFQMAYVVGLAAFASATDHLPRWQRTATSVGRWLVVAYSIVLVPLAWWVTPALGGPEYKVGKPPAALATAFIIGVREHARNAEKRAASLLGLLPQPPDRTPLSLLTGRWKLWSDSWIPALRSLSIRGRPATVPKQVSVQARGSDCLQCRVWPVSPGWPTVVTLRTRSGWSAASVPGRISVRVGSRGSLCLRGKPKWHDASVRRDVALFAQGASDEVLFHLVLSSSASPETITWYGVGVGAGLAGPQRACPAQVRFLTLLWACSGVEMVDVQPPEVLRPPLYGAPAEHGGVAGYEEISPDSWVYELDPPTHGTAVLCLPLVWRGDPALRVRTEDGQESSVVSLGAACPPIRPVGRVLLGPRSSTDGWQYRMCYVLLGLESSGSRGLMLCAGEGRARRSAVRVLLYGDAWDRERRGVLANR